MGPPPHQPGPPTSSGDDQRSVIILVLSLASFMVFFVGCSACGPLALLSLGLSIPAIVMARRDLALMDSGHMSPKGRDATKIGFVIAIVSTVISVLTGLAMIAVVAIYGGFFGMLALNESGAFQ